MTKKELVNGIMEELPEPEKGKALHRLEVECVLDAFGKVTAAELLGGGEITIPGVGKLKVKDTSARTGRDPRTGEKIIIAASRKVFFAPFRDFKDALKGE